MRIAGILVAVTLAFASGCLTGRPDSPAYQYHLGYPPDLEQPNYIEERPSAPTDLYNLAWRNLFEAWEWGMEALVWRNLAYKRACEAWDAVLREPHEHPYSWDHKDGFIAGFVDYLDAGGNGEPPAVPPYRYRAHFYQNPTGYRAMDEWFAGFRHGSAVAKDSGIRDYLLVPVTSPPEFLVDTESVQQPQSGSTSGGGAVVPPTPSPPSAPPAPSPEPLPTLPLPRLTPPKETGVRLIVPDDPPGPGTANPSGIPPAAAPPSNGGG